MYFVIEDQKLYLGEERYRTGIFFSTEAEAKDYAIRKAANHKGQPEYLIYKEIGSTNTTLPTEVTVTING